MGKLLIFLYRDMTTKEIDYSEMEKEWENEMDLNDPGLEYDEVEEDQDD